MTKVLPARDKPFRLEEATIGELHAAIKAEATTCVAVVQTYIARVRAYNGVASALVTEAVSYTQQTLPTNSLCRSRWSPYH
jgi:Asp-tRNA(Asn)/Glu-tRNA(Gln) amidotransferase A subunit family amidase